MGYLTLEVTLISAKDLKNVNLIGKMDVYVVGTLSDEPNSKQKTPVDQDGGTKPSWNHTMRFTINEARALQSNSVLIFQVKHDSFGPDKGIGEVRVPVSELVNSSKGQKDPQFVAYQVRRPSGKAHGELNLSYKVTEAPEADSFGLKGYPAQTYYESSSYGQPVAAYPTPPPGGYPHAPPPLPAGHPEAPAAVYPHAPPPPAGYPGQGSAVPYQAYGHPPQGYAAAPYGGYPPQPGYGYGYPPPPAGYPGQIQPPQKPKKSGGGGLGLGLGAGLIGGAVGGLIIGDMVSDALDDAGDCDF